jgi:hypothetical protein
MELNKALLERNIKTFEDANIKYGIFTKELLEFLGQDFFLAPASPLKEMYSAIPGGLLNHTIKVAKYAVLINNAFPENMRVELESLMKVAFICQIGKTFAFKPCESEWHRTNMGKMYEYSEDITAMKIGERSLFYAMTHGVKFSDEEAQAIFNYDKPEDDKQSRHYTELIGSILKMAIQMAIIEEKNNG